LPACRTYHQDSYSASSNLAYGSLIETSLAATTAVAAVDAAAEARRSPRADALPAGLPSASALANGSLIVTSVPAPGSLVISMLP
jgi:hypothetical protein